MKLDKTLILIGLITLAAASGCAHRKQTAKVEPATTTAEQAPGGVGYVDFHNDNRAPVPIYQLGPQGQAQLIAAAGKSSYGWDHTKVHNPLRVAAPEGTQRFAIEAQGPVVSVPVSVDKVTPVAIDYRLIDRGEIFVIYTADYKILPQTDLEKKRK